MSGTAEPYGREGLPLDQARQQLLASLGSKAQIDAESLPLCECMGRVNAVATTATADVPGFRASIMDGYALGQAHQPRVGDRWSLQGRSAAGAPFPGALKAGEAIRILTGAPLPTGADWVLPQELIDASDDTITLAREASASPWIRAADEECRSGTTLINAGVRLGAADLGRLAGCGIATLKVNRKPRIGLLVSGDELVPPGEQRPEGAIWESNSTLLEAMLHQLGYGIHHKKVEADQPDALRQSLHELATRCDVVVTTGGVSAGDTDWIRPLVAELGDVQFWKLFLKPGRPFAFGWIGNHVPFFGLPGNPVAAAITALQLLWPALQQLEGQAVVETFPRIQVELANQYRRRPGRPELARARLDVADDGRLLARIDGSQASSRIGSLQGADLLLEIPADAGPLEAGSLLWAQLLRRSLF